MNDKHWNAIERFNHALDLHAQTNSDNWNRLLSDVALFYADSLDSLECRSAAWVLMKYREAVNAGHAFAQLVEVGPDEPVVIPIKVDMAFCTVIFFADSCLDALARWVDQKLCLKIGAKSQCSLSNAVFWKNLKSSKVSDHLYDRLQQYKPWIEKFNDLRNEVAHNTPFVAASPGSKRWKGPDGIEGISNFWSTLYDRLTTDQIFIAATRIIGNESRLEKDFQFADALGYKQHYEPILIMVSRLLEICFRTLTISLDT